MKKSAFKIVLLLLLSFLVVTCAVIRDGEPVGTKINMDMSKEEYQQWCTYKDTIYRDSIAIAYIQNVEWEYISDDVIRLEISLTTMTGYQDNTIDIFRYMHAKQPTAKIEINTDDRNRINLNDE